MDADLIHEELSKDINGAAMTVLNQLKPGLDEKLSENALVIELIARGHRVEQQRAFPVKSRGRLVPDLIVDDLVIADPKAVEFVSDSHIAQMIGYLAIADLKLAPLWNFKCAKLQRKRGGRETSARFA